METVTGEVLNINNEYRSYQEYKAAVDNELQKSAESFVRIGYLLKVARDTDILKESGYGSVNEFAQAEYGLDKSQVSRFIRINDEYSEEGYSDRLQERYREFGYAKLSLMLLLPAAVNEEISANYSKSEIQAIKEEVEEEKKVTDLEVMMEGTDAAQKDMNICQKVLHQLGYDQPELYMKLHKTLKNTPDEQMIDQIVDVIAPAGEHIYSVRIKGEGRKLLSIKGANADPVIVDMRSEESQEYTWDKFIGYLEDFCGEEDAKENWKNLYGEQLPEQEEPKKTEVAPVQPVKKPSKVTKAKKQERKEKERRDEDRQESGADHGSDSSGTDKEPAAAGGSGYTDDSDGDEKEPGSESDTEGEQLPGQMQLEKDFPEYCHDMHEQQENTITYCNSDGTWGLRESDIKTVPGELYGAIFKLMQYERTGLSPEQIVEMDELYQEKCREVAEMRKLQEAAGMEEDHGEA